MGKRLVPIVQNVPVVPIVGDMPEIIILPELWRNTNVVVQDCSPHVVQRGVRRMVRVRGATRAAGRRVRKGNEVTVPGNSLTSERPRIDQSLGTF